MNRYLTGLAAALLGTAMITGTGLQTVAAAEPVPTTVTLPLFGAPLTIDITTGPGGALTDVSVDSANATVATHLKPRKVVFETANPDVNGDPGKVVVKSRHHGGQTVSARAGSLADVSGPGSWSGDLFGAGTASTVDFTIGAGADGGPDITGITASADGVVGDVKRSSDDDDEDDDEQSARVSIKFTSADGAQSRTITIKVTVENEDGTTEAKLSISVGRLKGVAVDAADAAGPHTWTGTLCDSSTATIDYTVAEDGSVSDVTATPATAEVKGGDHKIDVRFSHDERVRIKVRGNDGQIKISVSEHIRCDSDDPTTNVSTAIPNDDDDGDDHDGDEKRDGRDDGHEDDDDDSTTAGG